jgi:hypothetical protein
VVHKSKYPANNDACLPCHMCLFLSSSIIAFPLLFSTPFLPGSYFQFCDFFLKNNLANFFPKIWILKLGEKHPKFSPIFLWKKLQN